MTTEIRRDLVADLALSESVRGVYYDEGGGYQADYPDDSQPRHYFDEAYEGWPYAIRRAITAETENDLLFRILREIDGHIRATDDPIPYIVATLKRALPEYYEDGGDFFES